MSGSGKLAIAVLGVLAALPAGAGAEVITPHTVTPTVVTPQTVTPSTPTPTPPSPHPSSAPAPAPAPAPLPRTLAPGPLVPQDPGTGLRPTWVPSSKPGWEGVKENHDAIEHDLGGNLLNQTTTEIMKFELGTITVYDALITAGFLPPMRGPGSINSDELILHGDPTFTIKPDESDAVGDPWIDFERWQYDVGGEDPGGIREIIDGVFGTNATEIPPKEEQ